MVGIFVFFKVKYVCGYSQYFLYFLKRNLFAGTVKSHKFEVLGT